jgi:AraC-like DNA-binding protein
VFGSENGALLIDLNQLKSNSFIPPLVITGVSKENHPTDYAEGWNDVITLAPDERSLTLFFSALDYENTELVAYAYRMGGDENNWTYLGQNHSITLAQMHPGTYQLTIRSTNNDGVWCNNERTLTIIVQPTFWETPWAKLLIVVVIAAIALIVVSTILYIRRIKRQQREMLEAYLASLAEKESRPSPAEAHAPSLSEEDDRLMQQLMAFIEQNLGNSDITIDDMAKFVAVSRTSLHRKVKNLIGTTPMEFLREARIRKASQMLMQTSASVSQVAYECGFSDPKYFSKCFKAATGQTPTEYKASV